MEDLQIITLYFDRDEQALAETAQKYGKYCFAVANNILENKQDAEECVNDTYLHAWQSIPPTRPHHLKLFLAKITRNLAFNKYRAAHREKRGFGELPLVLSEMDEFLAGTAEIEEEARLAALKEALHRFLRGLTPRERGVFLRRYLFVETAEIISGRYGISETNVRQILSRTRQKLKIYLQKEGYTL